MTRSRTLLLVGLLLLIGATGILLAVFWEEKPPEPRYTIQSIAAVGTTSRVFLNNHGHVCFSDEDPNSGKKTTWVWTPDGSTRNIVGPGGSLDVSAFNDRGQVAGAQILPVSGTPRTRQHHAFVWSATTGFLDLSVEGQMASWAHHIHRDGRIVGISQVKGGTQTIHVWNSNGAIIQEPTRECLFSIPNRKDWEEYYPEEFESAYRKMAEVGSDFGQIGTNGSEVVGSWAPPYSLFESFSRYLQTADNPLVEVLAVVFDKLGLLVPFEDRDFAFLWDGGEILDLNDLIPPDSDWKRLQQAHDINDQGQIVGIGSKGGRSNVFLLTPIQENFGGEVGE